MLNVKSKLCFAPDGAPAGGGAAPAASPAPAAPASTVAPTTPGSNGVMGQPASPAAKTYKLKVNGSEMDVDESKLIEYAQKGTSADARYQEAAKIRKEAEEYKKYKDAYDNLEKLVSSKDVDTLEKILGEDIINGFVSKRNPSIQSRYSEEDTLLANELGVDVKDIVAVKNKAMGTHLPAVNKVMSEVEALKAHNAKLEKAIMQAEVTRKADAIESHFMNLSSKYPKADKREVIAAIERGNVTPDKFEELFSEAHNNYEANLQKNYEEYLRLKKESTANVLSDPSFGGTVFKEEDYNNMSSMDKKEKIKAALKAKGRL